MSIGRITVDLLAKTGSFETDLKRASKEAARRAKEIDDAFRKAGAAIGVALAAGATASAVALKSAIDRMDELSKAASKVGATTEQFSRLSYAASLADVSMDALTGALGRLTKAQAAALDGTGAQAQVFKALGVAVANADGSMRASTDVLADFADRFARLKGSPEAMAAGFELFGRSFQDLVPLLRDGADGLRAASEEADRLGITLSSKAGKDAEDFNDELTRLGAVVGGVANRIAAEMLPAMKSAAGELTQMAERGNIASNAVTLLSAGLNAGVGLLKAYENAVARTSIAMSAMAGIAGGLKEAVANFGIGGLFAEGSVAGGLARVRETLANEQRALDALIARQNAPAAPRAGGPLPGIGAPLEGAGEPLEGFRLPTGGGSRRTGRTGRSEGRSAADELTRAYESANARLAEQIALFGQVGEAARLAYELQFGGLAKLDEARKLELMGQAERLDLLNRERDALDGLNERATAKIEAATRELEGVEALIESMQFELSLLGLSNKEREREIALRQAGAAATESQRQQIAALSDAYYEASKAAQQWDQFERSVADTLVELGNNLGNAESIIKDFFDSIAQQILRSIAEDWAGKIADLFKGMSGTGWGSVLSSLFGGGRANGGPVGAGTSYLVGERGPELFVPRTAGLVIPAPATARMAGSGGFHQVLNVSVQGRPDRRTVDQIAGETGRAARRSMLRNGR